MGLVAWSETFEPTPSGDIDTGFPTGDDGSAAIPLAWNSAAFPSLVSLAAAFSQNVRTFLTEPTPGAALITLRSVSGADVSESGWTLAADVLANSSTTSNSGVLALDATYGATTVSLIRAWSRVATGGADTTPPTIPLGMRTSGTAAPIAITCQNVSEIPVTGQTPTGVRRINAYRNGTKFSETIAGTLAANILEGPSLLTFGAGTAANWNQTGNEITLTASGAAGFNGTTDEGALVAVRVSGTSWKAVLRITSHPGGATTAHAGLMVRATSDANSPFVQAYQAPDAATGSRARARLSAGATVVASPAVTPLGPPCDQMIQREADLYSVYRWSGTDWTLQDSFTVPMGNLVYVGGGYSSRQAAAGTVVFAELSISSAADVTFTDASPSATSIYTLKSEDVQGNLSPASDSKTVTLATTGPVTYKANFDWSDGIVIPANCAVSRDAPSGDYSQTIVNSTVLKGTALRQRIVRHLDGDKRIELAIQTNVPNFTDTWYGFAMHVRSEFTYMQGQSVFFQNHHTNYPQQTIVPFAMFIRNNQIGMWKQYRPDLNFPAHDLDRYENGELGAAFHTLTKGVRDIYVVNILWDPRLAADGGVGYCKIWRNDALVFSEVKPIGYGYPGNTMTYNPKIGVYGVNDPAVPAGADTCDIEHTEFRYAVGSNLYNAVRPQR